MCVFFFLLSNSADSNANTTSNENLTTEEQQQPQPHPQTNKNQAAKLKTLLNYEEGQWSPENTDGKKFYNRQQLVLLRDLATSKSSPQIQDQFQLIRKSSNFLMNANNNNNKNQSTSGDKVRFGDKSFGF